jgi:hypothetical protein
LGIGCVDRFIAFAKVEGGGEILRCWAKITRRILRAFHRVFEYRHGIEPLQQLSAIYPSEILLQVAVACATPAGAA